MTKLRYYQVRSKSPFSLLSLLSYRHIRQHMSTSSRCGCPENRVDCLVQASRPRSLKTLRPVLPTDLLHSTRMAEVDMRFRRCKMTKSSLEDDVEVFYVR
jgi:hypothetical protein